MNVQDLKEKISGFQDVLTACTRSYGAECRATRALRELYGRRSASALLSSVSSLCPSEIEAARKVEQPNDVLSIQCVLPSPDVVRGSVPTLLDAVSSNNWGEAVRTLQKMGVLALCLPPEHQFDRLEFIVGCVVGRARLIPLVELAIFAAEQRAFDRASQYLLEARTLGPGAPELHCLLTVEGLIALNSGNIGEAKRCLLESIHVCHANGSPLFSCRIHSFQVMLAEKLLEQGERETVASYLAGCQIVWNYQKEQIAAWIREVNTGGTPKFLVSGFMLRTNSPAVKLLLLTFRADAIGDELSTVPLEAETDISREKRFAENRRRTLFAIRGKLDAGKS